MTQELIDSYNNSEFVSHNKLNADDTVNTRTTNILSKYGFIIKDETQIISDLTIYKSDVFCGYDVMLHETKITDKTISVHHYASTWMTKKQLKKRRFQSTIKRIFGIKAYSFILKIKRKLFGISKT